MIPFRLVMILVVVILGTIAAEDIFKLLTSILPVLIVLAIAGSLGWGYVRHRRRLKNQEVIVPRKMVVFSDLTGQMVPEGEATTVIVRSHPMLTDPVQLDAALTEVNPLLEDAGEFVVLEITADGETKQVVTELTQFNGLFKGDAYQMLAGAQKIKTSKVTSSRSNNGAELAKIREWCRANGWADIKDKGRVPADAQAAYDIANPAA